MSCCIRLARGFDHQRHSLATRPGPIMGTWDYKWPLGSVLRVAFQRPAGVDAGDFVATRQAVREIAERWHDPRAAISFSFDAPDFEVPAKKSGQEHPRRRSEIVGRDWREYDLLVSLTPLPLTLEDTITDEEPLQDVFLPFSQIGTYARRSDYGVPTLFVGPMKNSPRLADYYQEPLAQTMVLHEFGHALGLAHEHQNPLMRASLGLSADDYDLHKAWELLIHRLGVPEAKLPKPDIGDQDHLTTTFLNSHLGQTWPGNLRFSDWRGDSEVLFESVMTVPYHTCALKPAAAERLGLPPCGCGARGRCDAYDKALFVKPTLSDKAFLSRMYPAPVA